LRVRAVAAGKASNSPAGRIGRRTSSPPQFGHPLANFDPAQSAQNVHSKLQIIAAADSGGKFRSQHSQFGLSSNIRTSYAQLTVA
jgi:hypothetical protein